jgi:hypothetical protein
VAEPVRQRLSFDDEIVRTVGVSHYQGALRRIAGAAGAGPVRREVDAALVPEPTNPHDPNAVRVEIDGELVGYLSREDAVRYGPAVQRLREHGRLLVSSAVISGRGEGSETPNLGLFLSLPSPTEAELEVRMLVGS